MRFSGDGVSIRTRIVADAILRFPCRRDDSMGMSLAPLYYTVKMVQALPDDGNRYEAVHGELLVTPSPILGHQRLAGRLFLALAPYVAGHRLGEIFMAPADLVHGPASIVEPDLLVLPFGSNERGPSELASALLLIEILSPSSSRADRFTKRRLYQEAGVPLYWVVDGERRVVEEWSPGGEFPRAVTEMLRWRPAGAEAPFSYALDELFRPAG
jgi:Uma2 family endonuclease